MRFLNIPKTLSFFLARILFFRLHESLRYLVHTGRHEEARLNLQKISRYNGSELSLEIDDVIDHHTLPEAEEISSPKAIDHSRKDVRTIFDANNFPDGQSSETEPLTTDSPKPASTGNSNPTSASSERPRYDSTGSSDVHLQSHRFITPTQEIPPPFDDLSQEREEDLHDDVNDDSKSQPLIERPSPRKHSRRSSLHEAKAKIYWALPRRIRKPLWAWLDKIVHVLSPEWRRTTILVWLTWCFMALGTFFDYAL